MNPHLWLEDLDDPVARQWAADRTARTWATFGSGASFDMLAARLVEIRDDDRRFVVPDRIGEWCYGLLRDRHHRRGIWRRARFSGFLAGAPEWESLLDLDVLADSEDENWIWAGAAMLQPSQSRALLRLSRGGSDAVVVREYDVDRREFVTDGFVLPFARSTVSWIDKDSIYVSTDVGHEALTRSGYPRTARRWERGTDLADAPTVFAGEVDDISVTAGCDQASGFQRHYFVRVIDTARQEIHLHDGTRRVRLEVPLDAGVSWHRDHLVVAPRTTWRGHPAGSLLATTLSGFLAGERHLDVLFRPDERTSLLDAQWTANHLVITTIRDVRTITSRCTPTPSGWQVEALDQAARGQRTAVTCTDPRDDDFLLKRSGFTTPPALMHHTATSVGRTISTSPRAFDTGGLLTEQLFATSRDGTQVPYFVTRRPGATGPAIMTGYGGFGKPRLPQYDARAGAAWLEPGGITIVANIRGGGEYGPEWHQQATRDGKYRSFEDFAAVARDAVDRGITTPSQLGCRGSSNGGLLAGVMLTRYPELFGAVVAQAPLLDMARYHQLLAGAAWAAEYGDPDRPEDWAWLSGYSPYHRVEADRSYPPILLMTSARDDRVHPGHARKMAARLEECGHEVHLSELTDGGHKRAATRQKAARSSALAYAFLRAKLGL